MRGFQNLRPARLGSLSRRLIGVGQSFTGMSAPAVYCSSSPTVRAAQRRSITSSTGALKDLLKVSEEVRDAVATNKPVVALESTIYTHGALADDLRLEAIVREHGGIPAVCGVLDGVPSVGLSPSDIQRMINEGASKLSRRDLASIVGRGLAGRPSHGGTTISGTMVLARLAGIRVFGTGGLGGVHRSWESTLDISADLTELGRTRVAVVSSGCKGFLDIPATLEFLETHGAFVATFADGRTGQVNFPAFWARDSSTKSPAVVVDEAEAAAIIFAQERLGIESGMLFANPIPERDGIPRAEMEVAIDRAVREAQEQGFTGSNNTPFVLRRIRELTQERSTAANVALVQSNVARAARVAKELSALLTGKPASKSYVSLPSRSATPKPSSSAIIEKKASPKADILVAGAVALDLSCDYASDTSRAVSPRLHTSNPSTISQSIGGVGHNVALAAHRASSRNKVKLCSMVGNDIAGATIMSTIERSGLDTSCIRQLGREYHSTRTAQYVAVNDADKNLMVAMADMAILTNHSFPAYWASAVAAAKPAWVVVDGNWGAQDIRAWVKAARQHNARVAFEPVSAAKSARLFSPLKEHVAAGVFPDALVDIATPNQHELAAMHAAAKENGYFDGTAWFEVVNAFGIMGGARDKFVRLTSAEMADAGIPVQTMQLLPYIPTIITKMGANGALLASLLKKDDPRLFDREAEPFILTRAMNDHPSVGGVYMRYFPPVARVKDVVSVNGVGDTFLGTLVAGLAQGGRVEDLMDLAQKAAVMTLRSAESVSPDLGRLEEELLFAARRRAE